MATAAAMANRHIVSQILHHLSDMKYKDRRQGGPDQPVEFLEFRPTLVPSILVNKLWAEEGTSILWKRYPHLPALKSIQTDRQQWYANKVERAFIVSPPPDAADDLAYLGALVWPSLKILELEVDWKRHGSNLHSMTHTSLVHLEILGEQSWDSKHITENVLPALLEPCKNLRSLRIGPDVINPEDPVHSQIFCDLLDGSTSIKDVRIMNANFLGNNKLFEFLSKRTSLEALEIDLDPGLQLLPFLAGAKDLFPALRRLHVMCYPETARALSPHLSSVQYLSMDIARIPDQPCQDADFAILDDLLTSLAQCKRLQLLKINIGQLAANYPSADFLPTCNGTSLVRLAAACPQLSDLALLASEPAAIDGSNISSAQFEDFCKRAPNLTNLSLKFHPGTAVVLEETALQSLGRHCLQLEVLRLKIALQLPSLITQSIASPTIAGNDGVHDSRSNQNINRMQKSQSQPRDRDYVEIKAFATHAPASVEPLFPHLIHVALARPQSVLSVTADTYSSSSLSHSSSEVDPSLEEDLVRYWAHALLLHFPQLDILEAWGDWTGHDNDSLNYFLPREEPLASTWEFLSGVEQDLWDEGQDDAVDEEVEYLADDFEERVNFDSRGSGDWERASLVNEFPEDIVYDDHGYLTTYDDEPDDMITPVEERQEWFAHTNSKLTAGPSDHDTHKPIGS